MKDLSDLKNDVSVIASEFADYELAPNWSGCMEVWPLFELMSDEGSVVVIKIDGERQKSDNGKYTIVVSQGGLGEDFFRLDTNSLDEGLARAVIYYSSKCWE